MYLDDLLTYIRTGHMPDSMKYQDIHTGLRILAQNFDARLTAIETKLGMKE